jgi:hypothetical protein
MQTDTLLGDIVITSDYIATFALLISVFTFFISAFSFYWINMRKSTGFQLVRLNTTSSISPYFALLNTGNYDILVTRIDCAFLNSDDSGWYAPEHNYQKAFTINSNKS